MDREEYFGSPAQQALQRRADDLWRLVEGDPRFCCHGRAVGLAGPTEDNLADQIALTRLQGASACQAVPAAAVAGRRAALEAAGLEVDEYVEWRGDAAALAAADAAGPPPADLTVVEIGPDTDPATLAALDALTQSCGVLLPMGAFVRGLRRRAVCLLARDASGRAVGAAASVAEHHPAGPNAGLAWWGMLATAPDRRGQGVARGLGAQALRAMRDRHGLGRFLTGVRAGNTASETLCAGLGFAPSAFVDVISIWPPAFGAARVTA